MISLSHLNKLILFAYPSFIILIFNSVIYGEDEPADIWKKKDKFKMNQSIVTGDNAKRYYNKKSYSYQMM